MTAQALARAVVGAAYLLLLAELLLLPVPSEASSLQQSRRRGDTRGPRRLLPFIPAAVVVACYLAPLLWVIWPPAGRVLLPMQLPATPLRLTAGVALVASGSALTLWSTLLLRGAGGRLLTTGPFALSRHPGVTGLAVLYLGAGILFPAWLLIGGLIAYLGHMTLRTAEEERALVARFGPRYHTYRRRVGRLTPLLAPLPAARRRRMPVAVLASGAGSNLRALCERSAAGAKDLPRARIVCVVSNNSGSGALAFAQERGISSYHVSARTQPDPDALSGRMLAIFARHRVELVLLAGYAKRLPAGVVATYRGRVLNLHPTLLPRHGGQGMHGLAPHRAVLAAGDSHTGVTVHWVDERYDEGAMLLQRRIAVGAGTTAEELQRQVAAVEHDTYWRAVNLAIDLVEHGG